MRSLLKPLSWLFGIVVAARNAAFDVGLFRARKAGRTVISVGNISAGGTGKTPVVEEFARILLSQGKKVAVLSRGYGRSTRGFRWVRGPHESSNDAAACGDEPVQIAANIQGAIVAVDEDRVHGAKRIVEETQTEVLLLDDAFQHRWIHRDLEVVLTTLSELDPGDSLLPSGRLREPMGSLRRAHAVIVTGLRNDEEQRRSAAALGLRFSGPMHFAGIEPSGCMSLDGTERPLSWLAGRPILAFSGIGNPAGFETTLREAGCDVRSHVRFPDHHIYTSSDLDRIRSSAKREGIADIVTTQKDAVRLSSVVTAEPASIYALSVRVRWRSDGREVEKMLSDVCSSTRG